jgi:hypothetical protein
MKIKILKSGAKPTPDFQIRENATKAARMGIPESANPFHPEDECHKKWHSFYQQEIQKVGESFG